MLFADPRFFLCFRPHSQVQHHSDEGTLEKNYEKLIKLIQTYLQGKWNLVKVKKDRKFQNAYGTENQQSHQTRIVQILSLWGLKHLALLSWFAWMLMNNLSKCGTLWDWNFEVAFATVLCECFETRCIHQWGGKCEGVCQLEFLVPSKEPCEGAR